MTDNNIEFRSFEIRSVDLEKRTIEGLAVPYGETIDAGGFFERVERGVFGDVKETHLYFNHDWNDNRSAAPIGKVYEVRDSEEGLHIKARLSNTPKGEEVYTLLRDGVLDKFSVAFTPIENRFDDDVVVRTKARLLEVSVVPIPAYAKASVAQVRSAEELTAPTADHNTKEIDEKMTENVNAPEVAELREAVGDLEREVRSFVAKSNETKEDAAPHFRSAGEFLKAKYEGAPEARAYTGATFADNDNATRPAWLAEQLRLVEEKRQVLNLFTRLGLPDTGMSVTYPQVTGATGTVGEQVAEGDDLNYLEVTVGTASADVKTYGGYTSLSRQLIERSEVAMLDVNVRHLFNQYAKATEAAVRSAFTGATGVNTGTLADDTAAGWIDIVLDSAALINDNAKGAQAEFVVVSRDVFKRLAHMVDTSGRPLFVINGDGVNSLGNVNVRGASANIAGFPVVRADALPANSLYVASSEALTVWEDPTKSLQDENIINLTKDFSVYGYMAIGVTNPLAIVKVDADLVV